MSMYNKLTGILLLIYVCDICFGSILLIFKPHSYAPTNQITDNLMVMHKGCLEGDLSLIQELEAAEPPNNALKHISKVIVAWLTNLCRWL
ncbi:OLC1v1008745C1 [Oldenlandia corymbosa var. corymbosa]|uniref:OLC1v1008745C1 n=1 Tax=Oldenlandia corymbosa var. corymbosa TaxID=529605 RepID=A0AAV1DPS5_OLDCO|nr:OLC1v1008745C1 [Oldenlandia corymbosa var. corymbosa]